MIITCIVDRVKVYNKYNKTYTALRGARGRTTPLRKRNDVVAVLLTIDALYVTVKTLLRVNGKRLRYNTYGRRPPACALQRQMARHNASRGLTARRRRVLYHILLYILYYIYYIICI